MSNIHSNSEKYLSPVFGKASSKASGGIYINGHYVCRVLKDNLNPEILLENNILSKESPDILEVGDPA